MDEIKDQLAEIFAMMPVDHGEWFDDGRRWCVGCSHPRRMTQEIKDDPWKSRTCSFCQAVWPEYAEEFMHEAMTDDEFLEQFPEASIN